MMTASERIRLARLNAKPIIRAERAARQRLAEHERKTADLARLMRENRSHC